MSSVYISSCSDRDAKVLTHSFTSMLRPSVLFAVLTAAAVVLWLSVDPEVAYISGVAAKFNSPLGFSRFVILALIMFCVLRVSENTGLFRFFESRDVDSASAYRWTIGFAVLYFIGIGGLFINFASNYGAAIAAMQEHNSVISSVLGDTDSGFLSNLCPLVVAMESYLLFANELDRSKRKNLIVLLVISFLCALFEAFTYTRRIQFFFCLFAFAVPILVLKRIKFNPWKIFFAAFAIFAGIVAFELSRWGMQNANRYGLGLFSIENVSMTARYILTSYLYSDLNNALVFLGNDPDFSLVYGAATQITDLVWGFFGIDSGRFNFLSDFTSGYGTVNVLGIWWESAGWLSIAYIASFGTLTGCIWRSVSSGRALNIFGVTMLILVILGVFNDTRINYFFTTKFMIPFAGLAFMYFFSGKKSRASFGPRGSLRQKAAYGTEGAYR